MHRGCFVWTPTPPLAGRRTPRPGPVRVCVCLLFLAGSGGPASQARSGAPHLFLWPLWLSALLGPIRAGVAPVLVLFSFFRYLFRAPPFSPAFFGFRPRVPWALALCVVCLVGLALLGPPCALAPFVLPAWLFVVAWWLPPPPPLWCLAVFLAAAPFLVFFISLSAPPLSLAFSGFRPRVPWALALCFAFFFSRLSALRALSLCFSCLAVGCSLAPGAPPPPSFVSGWFRRCRSVPPPFFFFPCVRPRCLWLSLVSGPGCPGPWRCVLFALWASCFSALRALSPFSVSRLAVGCSLVAPGKSIVRG